MADLGQSKTDKQLEMVRKRLEKVYKEASKDMQKKVKEYTKKHDAMDARKRELVKQGKLTEAEYKRWQQGQVFIGKQWQSKVDQIAESMVHVEENANRIVHEGQINTFADNANYFEYSIDKDMGFGGNFSLYDTKTVVRLISEEPELLKRRHVDSGKSKAWNAKKVANAVTQGIIQGESISAIAARIARDTASSDMKAMLRYARTAMTGAQNAGRLEAMRDSNKQGLEVRKVWLATLDDRTRDAHADLDGQIQEVEKPFESELGPIMYPGDPGASDENIWNCRCALGYDYKDSPSMGERYDQEAGEVIADMTYDEWERSKKAGLKADYSKAKANLYSAMKDVLLNDAQHVFKGIWKDDVTYADYFDKEGSIAAKRQYFQDRIDRAVATGDTANEQKFTALMKELELFEKNGLDGWSLLNQLEVAKEEVKDLADQFPAKEVKQTAKGGFKPEDYSQARKDAALWAKSSKEADNALRAKSGEVWKAATAKERDGIFEYTQSYHKYNEPLRGIEYGSSVYKGVGNTDLNAGRQNNGERLNAMTDIINKSTYDIDVWLQRGCSYGGMDKFFQIDASLLQYGTEKELKQALLGKTVTEYAFGSCGSSRGSGFSSNPIIMNIYCPKGTKMMYVEPFSYYGHGKNGGMNYSNGLNWDGNSKQPKFGSELETILQQGTQFRVAKVERNGMGTIYVDLEVIAQDNEQRWK